MIKNEETKVIKDEFLPLQEIPLAEGSGSLVREVLPDIYIYPKTSVESR